MRRTIITAALVGVALLSACGPQAPSADELVVSSASATQDAGSANMAMEMRMSGGAQEVTINATGAFEFDTGRGAMTMNMGDLGAQMGMGDIEMRTDGTTIYMKMPAAMNPPTPWVKMDLDTMTGVPGMGQLQQFNNNDPRATMELLRGVADVEELGSEEIRGTATTHYKGMVDLEKAIAEAPPETKKALRQQYQLLGITEVPVDVWVDDEGLLRRQDITMDLSKMDTQGAPAGQVPTSMFMRMELFDFGTDVDVKPPPAGQVTDMADLQQGG